MRTKTTKMRKLGLFFQALKRKINKQFDDFTRYEPVQKAEAVENTLYLLRRDFTITEQNEIVVTLVKRLHDKREAEIVKLHKEMELMREETQKLREFISAH